jgi:hypothetical protein
MSCRPSGTSSHLGRNGARADILGRDADQQPRDRGRCQIGTAFAVRTDHASLRSVGVFSNRFLLGAIGIALAFAGALIDIPALNSIFGTAPLTGAQLVTVAPFPFIVWGADELRRLFLRHHRSTRPGMG